MAIFAKRNEDCSENHHRSWCSSMWCTFRILPLQPFLPLQLCPSRKRHIFPYIPETKLIALLVVFTTYFWILDFLNIECRHLPLRCVLSAELVCALNRSEMGVYFVLYAWASQSLCLFTIAEPCLGGSVTCCVVRGGSGGATGLRYHCAVVPPLKTTPLCLSMRKGAFSPRLHPM